MNIVFIEGLKINSVIGVYEWERAIKQTLSIDLKIHHDMNNSFLSDNIKDAINYKTICEEIEAICHKEQPKLLEYLANIIIQHILDTYPCQKVELTIKKPNAIKNAEQVGVMIIRTKNNI